MLRDGHDHYLHRRDARRQHETVVVAMGHNQAADDARGETPRGLVGVLLLVVLVGEGDVELLGEALPEVVACAGLKRLLVVHHALYRIGVHSARELFLVGLVATDDGHGEVILAEVGVDLKLLKRLLAGFLLGSVEGVSLLPEEFAAAQEGTSRLFPAQYGAPLVIQHRQIAP